MPDKGEPTSTCCSNSGATSSVLSCPELSSAILFALMSKPTTGNFVANKRAKGKPTYPRPITAIFYPIQMILGSDALIDKSDIFKRFSIEQVAAVEYKSGF